MNDIKTSLLITEEQIQKRVQELAQTLDKQFKNKQVIAIGVLKGAFTFYSDLMRKLTCEVLCDFCTTSSYGKNLIPSKEVRLTMDISLDIAEKHVLLVEDITDRGRTLHFLQAHLKSRKPASLTTVTLVNKPNEMREQDCQVDHVGFEIGKSSFLVGYGLDYQEQFRHLPYIAEVSSLN